MRDYDRKPSHCGLAYRMPNLAHPSSEAKPYVQTVIRSVAAVGRPPNAPPRFARSGQMVECLRQEMLYSDKRARDLLFVAIEQLVAERPPMMVLQLTRESALRARRLSERSGFELENWSTVSRAVM